jgi:hypothetical protein
MGEVLWSGVIRVQNLIKAVVVKKGKKSRESRHVQMAGDSTRG